MMIKSRRQQLFFFLLSVLYAVLMIPGSCSAQRRRSTVPREAFYALPLSQNQPSASSPVNRYGIPFVETAAHPQPGGVTELPVGSTLTHIFLLGMTESAGVHAWGPPRDYTQRFFVGDNLGNIRIDYEDGSAQVFPLILGESVWWGKLFYQYSDPFSTDAAFRSALSRSLRLYPAAPVEDGNYVAVIVPRAERVERIEIENSTFMKGGVAVSAVTVEASDSASIPGATTLAAGQPSAAFAAFMRSRPLLSSGVDACVTRQRLQGLKSALYSSNDLYNTPVASRRPAGYSGPGVSFQGTVYASILQNAFSANVQDMLDKIGPDGMYHTSTQGAVSWGGAGFGTYRTGVGIYYGDSWSRDMGRTLQELAELGYLSKVSVSADYAFRKALLWSQDPNLKYQGNTLPPHWGRVLNKPSFAQPFENDGHGLLSLAIYKLWQRLPNRNAWLRAHWADVKAAADWIPWQLDHPSISGASDGLLLSTGEAAHGKGHSVYPDVICMTALEGFARMADSIGETQSARLWRTTAENMRKAISAHYIVTNPQYGRVWTLKHAGWPNQSTVLGPLILTADLQGFAPGDIDPAWKAVDEATYERLIHTFYPFGFYGWAMGYGQGFVTQSALLLDQMRDATTMLDWTAKEIYDPRFGSFIVPEGVQVSPSGRFWYRTGDLGNGVQEAEIVKALRIVIGVDDSRPRHLRILPRMPYGWTEMGVAKYPVLVDINGKMSTAHVDYHLLRAHGHMRLSVSADRELGPVSFRVGPFAEYPFASDTVVNGKSLAADASVGKSGDSWWVSFTLPVGPDTARP